MTELQPQHRRLQSGHTTPGGQQGALRPWLPDLPWEGRAWGALLGGLGMGSPGGASRGERRRAYCRVEQEQAAGAPQTPAGISAKRSEDQGWGGGWIWSQGVRAAGAQL